MVLSLQGLIPVPLREKVMAGKSSIWNNSCVFRQGESVFVQAPSGTGKTTLIHILYGIRTDYEGSVKWEEKTLNIIPADALATLRKSDISVIFQDLRLFPELTTLENLEAKRRLTNSVSEPQVLEWLARLGIREKAHSLGRTLSYGEQQRVAIIRALLQPFSWLLMDEPFSHLDKANTARAIELITEVVQQRNAGMILADLDENNFFPYSQTVML